MKYSSYTELYLNELFPSAIMFGMSSKEFWEDDPQLYWAYRISFLKTKEIEGEELNYKCWLEGSYTFLATSIALNNAFAKKKLEFPKEPYGKGNKKEKTKLQLELEKEKDKNIRQQMEYNYWARL